MGPSSGEARKKIKLVEGLVSINGREVDPYQVSSS